MRCVRRGWSKTVIIFLLLDFLFRASSAPNVFGGTASLAVDEALGLPPTSGHAEPAPHVRSSAFQQVDAVGVGWEGQLEGVVGVIAVAVPVDQSFEGFFDLFALSAARIGVRQVEKHVAVDHLSRTTRKSLAHPYGG